MKHNQMKNEMQQTRNIKDVYTEKEHHVLNLKTHRMQSSIAPTCETGKRRAIERNSTPNIFLVQNKGKGPPGRQRSPVGIKPNRFHKPVRFDQTNDIISDPHSLTSNFELRSFHPSDFETITNTKNDDYKFYKFNFSQLLNSIFMKKQFLFLVLFVLAVFAGINKSFAQDLNYIPATACAPVTTLPCATDDPLHPLPGKSYTYNATVNPAIAAGGYVQWYVYNATTVGTIITGGDMSAALTAAEKNDGSSKFLLLADATKYNLTTNTSGSIDVQWQSFDGTANQILLVAYVKGNGGCSDNIEVFRIQPNFAFTLDIAGLMPTGALPTSGNAVECLSPVQSAVYNSTNLTMDYGENYVFFTVTAANFVHSWQPTFSIDATATTNIATPVAVSDITWAYPTEAIKTTGGTWNAATAPVLAQAASKAVGATGECIIVRVHLDHGNVENDAATTPRTVTIGVDGVMYNVPTTDYSNNALKDLDPVATAPCTNTVTDKATYDLTARPEITTTTLPAPGFVPKN